MKEKRSIFFAAGWLAVTILVLLSIWWLNGKNVINSDDASEMILAKILSEGNGILTRGWVYSTELRVVNTQLIRSFLFRFTDNWTLVHVLGNLGLYLWLLLSYAFFIIQLTQKKSWFWYTAPFLLIPFSHDAFYVFGLMGYYIPHLSFSFLILGLCGYLYREKKYKKTAYIAALLFSFLSCMGGLRQIMITFIPMWLALFFLGLRQIHAGSLRLFLRKYSYLGAVSAAGIAGYIVNTKFMSQIYLYKSNTEIHLQQPTMERLQVVLRGILNGFGYTEEGVPNTLLFSGEGIFFLLSLGFMAYVIFITVLLWKQKSRLQPLSQFLLMFGVCGLLSTMLLFLFTDMDVAGRYYVLQIIWFVPLFAIFYLEADYSLEVRRGLFGIAVLLISILGIGEYRSCLKSEENENRMGGISYLEGNGYSFGYGSFWNANVTTELTEGRIEIAPIEGGGENPASLMPWLTKLDTLFPAEEQGPVFLILHVNERNRYAELIEGKEAVYEDGDYYLYSYNDTSEFLDILEQ